MSQGSKFQKQGEPITAGRPEPMTLDAIFESLTTPGVAPQNKAYAIVALNSVVHHPTVKKILSNPKYQPVLKCLVLTLAQGDVYSYEARWETLATIGELCRVEHNPETRTANGIGSGSGGGVASVSDAASASATSNATALNQLAKYFYSYFGNLGFFKSVLNDCINDLAGDEDVKIAARDVIEAFSVPATGGGASSSSTKAGSAAVEEDEILNETESALATKWTKETKSRCKNLLYLDASNKYHLVPLVAKGSSAACAGCNNALSTAPDGDAEAKAADQGAKALRCGQCKAVFYCSQACQVAHWKAGHKAPCVAMKESLARYLAAGGSRAKDVLFPLESDLYYPTRRYMYECRPEFMKNISFQKLFMEYNCPDLL